MYDVIVIGGGHAGVEACLACARIGHKTLLITGNKEMIASMPCNPSIGGPAKGIVVREIDALGGEMGRNADKANIQMKMLNSSKGPAVRALRAQADKIDYPKFMRETIFNQENLDVVEGYVENLIICDKKVCGVVLNGIEYPSLAVIMATGTYLRSKILVGHESWPNGPDNQKTSQGLSDQLKAQGFHVLRLKTGTPQRVLKSSIDFSKTTVQYGDCEQRLFSFDNNVYRSYENQVPCHLTYTNDRTHKIILENLKSSAMYGGMVEGVGPRYCPSIEDKVVRFNDKERHQIFLEPESVHYDEIYVQGFSTSMPHDIQEKMVRTLPGLENCKIVKYAYAIEYDAFDPMDLDLTLESKLLENLYFAGQINGTSGYEEAACQGLMAGINASLKIRGKAPLILRRNEAYIGVLIDDLINKGTKEPYRLLTSRAEFRLLLRHDNADLRLREYGYNVGLIDEIRYKQYLRKKEMIKEVVQKFEEIKITPNDANLVLEKYNSSPIREGVLLSELIRRPEIDSTIIRELYPLDYDDFCLEEAEIQFKYSGYIEKSFKQAEKMLKLEEKSIPDDINYDDIINIALEAKEKLKRIRPTSIGQASRISGVNPADISVLLIYIEARKR